MNEIVTWLLDAVASIDPVTRALTVGVAMLLETSVLVGLIVPGDTIVLVAGTAVSSWPEGLTLGAVVVAGSMAGESIGFALGRYFGPRLRASRVGKRVGHAQWARADRFVHRRGGPAVFLSRFLPVLHALVPVTVGMSGMRYRRFVAWTLPACIVWAGLYIGVAAVAAGTFRRLADTVHSAGYVFVAVIVVFFVAVAVVRRFLIRGRRPDRADSETE
jgi:membrane-associated protein